MYHCFFRSTFSCAPLTAIHLTFFPSTIAKMMITTTWRVLTACMLVVGSIQQIAAQTAASPTITSAPQTNSTSRSSTGTSAETLASAPDVYLNVPTLHVGRIELDVDNLNGMHSTRQVKDES